MALEGFRKCCLRSRGGIENVALIPAKDVESVEYDTVTECYVNMRVCEGAGFVKFQFAEDDAIYTERISLNGGQHVVRHELKFTLRGMNCETKQAVEGLVNAHGLVALVEGRQGETLLVGWSQKFGTEQPLRIQQVIGSMCYKPEELPNESISLTAVDTEKAKPFTGEIPWIN